MTTHATGHPLPQPLATGRRFVQLRKQLAAALAAPVFTDAERELAAANAQACVSMRRLIIWLRNVQRVAVERAVAQAKQRTTEREAAQRLRQNTPMPHWQLCGILAVQQIVENPVFSAGERRTALSAAAALDCDRAQLGRWVRNLARLLKDREDQLWLAHELGFPTGPLSAQRGSFGESDDHRGGLAA